MNAPRIILLHKLSTFEFLRNSLRAHLGETRRFALSHKRHYTSLRAVENFLRAQQLRYHKARRGQAVDYSKFDIVITVGGDGTFLEAARHLKKQIILGVNSDPELSVGRFCVTDAEGFPQVFRKFLHGKSVITKIHRLELTVSGHKTSVNALNDILICHRSPAAMSHYYLQIGARKEEQRSSGVWVATAAGSTGAIHSAGGRPLKFASAQYQYLPREIYFGWRRKYKLTGKVLPPAAVLRIKSLMRDGKIFIDGAHQVLAFPFGHTLKIKISREPLRVVGRG